jgi:phosphopentomutase
MGKDTTTGHWEIAGLISESAMPTFPEGFPKEFIDAFEKAVGRGTLCNLPYSGTEVIKDYGKEHLESGALIVYTSADSVFQIAAHEEIVPPEKLYEYCKAARDLLVGEHSVGRVIARPFAGASGSFVRTANRRDFSLRPQKETSLDRILSSRKEVIAVGKITDIFAGCGISESILTHSNAEGMKVTEELLSRHFEGLAFINLVEFDSHYGHRQDKDGYAAAISEFDSWLGGFLPRLGTDNALIITADHGRDPADNSTDHTREYVPLFIYDKLAAPKNLGTVDGFGYIAKAVEEMLTR